MAFGKGEFRLRNGEKAIVTVLYMGSAVPLGGFVMGISGHRWALDGKHYEDPEFDIVGKWVEPPEPVDPQPVGSLLKRIMRSLGGAK